MRHCRACAGSGWVIVERNGFSGAERCRCSQVQKGVSGKPDFEEIVEAVVRASDVIPFFPQNVEAMPILAAEIQSFVSDRHSFEVFRQKLLRATAYEGLGGLRTLYCSLFEPADGEYPSGSEDAEGRARMREIEENTRRFEYYRRQAKLLPPPETLFLLPPPAMVAPEPATKLVARPVRSLKAREDELAAAIAKAPARSEEERRQLVEEIERRLQVA